MNSASSLDTLFGFSKIGKVVEGKCKGASVFLCPSLEEKWPPLVVGGVFRRIAKHARALGFGELNTKMLGLKRWVDLEYLRSFKNIIEVKEVKHINNYVFLQIKYNDGNLINDGVNVVAVSRRLGHSDVSMTLRVYTHLFQKIDLELVENIENSSHDLLTGTLLHRF